MNRSLRLPEKWFVRGLWLLSVVFAMFLVGFGSLVVADLPRAEGALTLDTFMDPAAAAEARADQSAAESASQEAQTRLEQATLALEVAQQASRSARETFENWLATRQATAQPGQDAELIARTRALDGLKDGERAAHAKVDAARQASLDAQQGAEAASRDLARLQDGARAKLDAAQNRLELRVFGWRLALVLPLLLVAGWLFVKKRKGAYWPFVWGFIFFALFTFFVELVPYLPSYGGYVYYLLGLVLTVVGGRYAVAALQRYRARQALAEAQPDRVRRDELSYDTALARLGKGVCPGCERPVDLKNTAIDFCPHCGIGLFDHCGRCDARKSAFSKFCHSCGAAAQHPPFSARGDDVAPPSFAPSAGDPAAPGLAAGA